MLNKTCLEINSDHFAPESINLWGGGVRIYWLGCYYTLLYKKGIKENINNPMKLYENEIK